MMVLVTGGSSSGKSAWAEKRLMKFGEKHRLYLATMIAWDMECVERIKKHREMRARKGFTTLECPVDVAYAKIPPKSAVLLECLSNLTANELYREDAANETDSPEERIFQAVLKLREKAEDLVVVTGEVFSDGQAYGEETAEYMRVLGNLNRRIAAAADEVVEVVCKTVQYLKAERPEGNREPVYRHEKAGAWMKLDNNMKEELHMKLILGGAYQGKLDFAFRLVEKEFSEAGTCKGGCRETACQDSLVADGSCDGEDTAFKRKILNNFHEYVRRFFLDAPDPERKMEEFLNRMMSDNPDAVIVSNEVGCGIIPVEKKERLWRELCGDGCQMIADKANEVYRVVCGLPVQLKGGQS